MHQGAPQRAARKQGRGGRRSRVGRAPRQAGRFTEIEARLSKLPNRRL